MICTYCNRVRPNNEGSCPNCGAPSPLLGQGQASLGDWGNAEPMSQGPASAAWDNLAPTSDAQWNNPASQLSFDQLPTNDQLPKPAYQQWGNQTPQASSQPLNEPSQPPQSYLPVPYQAPNQMGYPPFSQQNPMQALVPVQGREQMLPALPQEDQAVHVPPMYTKPRPIVPRYRIISGILSVLIVAGLLCSGSVYYARASGKFDAVMRFITGAPPSGVVTQQQANLPDPPAKRDQGPAVGMIPSAATAIRVNGTQPVEQGVIFRPGQTFYLTFSTSQNVHGTITVKWFTNGTFYQQQTQRANVPEGQVDSGAAPMQYAIPAEGQVELYWNDQLALRLYFVVR